MASSHSPSSSQEPSSASKASSRRLPPPCWSHHEIVALIDVYRYKWYSLRRGNLRAGDWQEVADGVASRCPLADPPKTSIQCRHKMEKLRKRYRGEIQRRNRFPSSWVHFKLMDSMELGTSVDPSIDDDEVDDLLLYPKGIKQAIGLPPVNRIKIPNLYPNNISFDEPLKGSKEGCGGGGMKRKKEGNVMDEMVAAIHRLGDGFVKMERMKMDMARELESMRLKMEIQQTEMILETQQKLWDSFSQTLMGKKKNKKPTPESSRGT